MAKGTRSKAKPGERLFENGGGVIFVGHRPASPAADKSAPTPAPDAAAKPSPAEAKANGLALQARLDAMTPAQMAELERLEYEALVGPIPADSASPTLDLQNLPFDPAIEADKQMTETLRKAGKMH